MVDRHEDAGRCPGVEDEVERRRLTEEVSSSRLAGEDH
jgi:hypothetical protein